MKKIEWPTCTETLTPFKPHTAPPFVIVEQFRLLGWSTAAPLPIQMVALLGSCSTGAFLDCKTLPEWHTSNAKEWGGSDYFNDIGRYYWCDVDVIDGNEVRYPLRLAINCGDADCNDGVWGLVWDRKTGKIVAEVSSAGDSLGLVKVVSKRHIDKFAAHKLPIPTDRAAFWPFMSPTNLKFGKNDQLAQLIAIAIGWCAGYAH